MGRRERSLAASIDQSRARSRIGTLYHPGIFARERELWVIFNVRSFSRRRRRRRYRLFGREYPVEWTRRDLEISKSPDRVDGEKILSPD